MKSVYVLMHDQKPNIEEIIGTIACMLRKAGIRASAEPWLYERMKHSGNQPFQSCSSEGCEAIISVGGDGTLLRANLLAMDLNLPVLGVNVGRVGFLAELEMNQLEQAFEKLAKDDYTIQERMMLKIMLGDEHAYALNDVVVSR